MASPAVLLRLGALAVMLALALYWRSPGVSPAALTTALVLVVALPLAVIVGARALARRAEPEPAPAVEPAEADAPARASWHLGAWAGAAAVACVGLLVLAPVLARAGGRLPTPPAWVLVAAAAGLLTTALMIFRSGAGADQSLTDLSSGGGADGLREWQADVPTRWSEEVYDVPRLVRTHPREPALVIGTARIVGPVRPVPGGVAFGLDLTACRRVGDDVAESVEPLRRMLGAEVVLVQPGEVATVALLTAYRGQPWTGRPGERVVDWRTIRALDDPDAVCVGESAYADLLADAAGAELRGRLTGQWRALFGDVPPPPTLSGIPAEVSADGCVMLYGAPKVGKTGGLRALTRGHIVRAEHFGEFLRVNVINNKGDFTALRAAALATGGRYVTDDAGALEVFRAMDRTAEQRYAEQGEEYEHDARDPLRPRELTLVGEWLKLGEQLSPKDRAELLRLGEKIATTHRAAKVQWAACAQLAEKDKVGPVRDVADPLVLHTESAGQSKMALDAIHLSRGASPHTIPKAARGVHYSLDRFTGWPTLARFGWIPKDDQHEALVAPLVAMGARMRRARQLAEPAEPDPAEPAEPAEPGERGAA